MAKKNMLFFGRKKSPENQVPGFLCEQSGIVFQFQNTHEGFLGHFDGA